MSKNLSKAASSSASLSGVSSGSAAAPLARTTSAEASPAVLLAVSATALSLAISEEAGFGGGFGGPFGSPSWFARIRGAVEGSVTSWKKMPSFFSVTGFFAVEEEEEAAAEEETAAAAASGEEPARGFPGTASGLSTTPGTSARTVTSALLAPGSSCGRALATAPLTKAASCAGSDAATAGAERDDFSPFFEFIEAASLVAAEDMFS